MNKTAPAPPPLAIGVDVGGTKIAAGLVTTQGHLRQHRSRPTPKEGAPETILAAITQLVTELQEHADGATPTVGVGTGGIIDHSTGVVVSANSLLPGWKGTPLGPALAERTGLTVTVDNDANTHALGELHFGAARGTPDVLFAAVGTGIGGALALGGQLRRGVHNVAGDIGHQPVPNAADRRCNCRGAGHLEAIASGPAILSDYQNRGGTAADLQAVASRATAGDRLAMDAIAYGARSLGRALAGVAAAIDPHTVVVGGGVAQMGAVYWDPLRSAFSAESHTTGVEIRPARLAAQASIVGAATLAFDLAPAWEESQ